MTDKLNPPQGDVQAALDAGLAMANQQQPLSAHGFVVLPAGASVRSLEQMCGEPQRPRGTVSLRDMRSFIAYVVERSSEEPEADTRRIYGVVTPKPSFRCVFNDHGATHAGWRDDIALFDCPLSEEWQRWTAKNGVKMDQEAFAQHIEDNLPDIAEPTAADMLEVSRSLEAKKKVNFASGLRLSNGQTQFTYEEQVEGTAAKGRILVPEVFALGVPVFEGGDRYRLEARLRYRIADGGKLTMWYDLLRPHKIIEDATAFVWKSIEAELGCKVLNGGITA